MPAGRPPKWKTVEDLESDIQAYIEDCNKKDLLIFQTGFADFVGCHIDTVQSYLNEKPSEFSVTLKRMLQCGEVRMANELRKGDNNIPGSIFIMKNCYKWKDKTEQQIESNTKVEIEDSAMKKLQATDKGRKLLEQISELLDDE